MSAHTKEQIMNILSAIPDPEIPVVNIAEIGMLRDVRVNDEGYEVIITPTYTGCPAISLIEQEIKVALKANGIFPATVRLVYDPAWTTDWISSEARKKLAAYGIAPPLASSCAHQVFEHNEIECPRCHSRDTTMLSRFGATACKALYKCNNCKDPFEYFKCH